MKTETEIRQVIAVLSRTAIQERDTEKATIVEAMIDTLQWAMGQQGTGLEQLLRR